MVGADPAARFLAAGWIVLDLEGADAVRAVRDALLDRLRASVAPRLDDLGEYHLHVTDADHERVHYELASWCWQTGTGRRIAAGELPFLQGFVGADLHVQRYPYLRIARPGRAEDVTGMHRDTLYGASPYEVSLVVPLVDLEERSALRVVTGSHTEPADRYPARRTDDPAVEPGSRRHQLGHPYAPQVLDADVFERSEPVTLRVGQALLMSLGLVHGQEVNAGDRTRISVDVRVVNSLAPVAHSRGVRPDYYEPLCESPVTAQARRHLAGSGPGND